MAANSKIQWTDHTFNPWEGCTKVAPECAHCYAETLVDHRFGRVKWGKGQPRRRTSENLWKQPLAWNRQVICDFCGTAMYRKAISFHPNGAAVCRTCSDVATFHRPRVFCLSLGDWLDEEVPMEWRRDLLDLIRRCGNLDWQLLTKRPQNFFELVQDVWSDDPSSDLGLWLHDWLFLGSEPLPDNIWIGVSAGADQKAALEIPAKVHFLSCEPMLHALDTTHAKEFDQIIFGGESGKNARTCHIEWISEGVRFCRQRGIAPFVKQLGAVPVTENANLFDWPENVQLHTGTPDDHGFAFAYIQLRDSHGGAMSEWPEDLRIREFPAPEGRRPEAAATAGKGEAL